MYKKGLIQQTMLNIWRLFVEPYEVERVIVLPRVREVVINKGLSNSGRLKLALEQASENKICG